MFKKTLNHIESKKFNVENTVRDVHIIFKMMYERSKILYVIIIFQYSVLFRAKTYLKK